MFFSNAYEKGNFHQVTNVTRIIYEPLNIDYWYK